MKTSPFLQYVLYDIFGESAAITARAMMGSFVLYYEGRVFAIVTGDELYFKGDRVTSSWYLERGSKQFSYTKEGKLTYMNYFVVAPEIYENKDMLEEWLEVALSVAKLPKKRK